MLHSVRCPAPLRLRSATRVVPSYLSVTTKLAPKGLLSQMLAVWFLATAVGDSIGGQLVRLVDIVGWAGYFVVCGIGTIILGGLFCLVVPRIKKLMEGVS